MSDTLIAILRVIHIAFGAFWLGGAITVGFFLLPTINATGVIGSQFATQLLTRTRLLTAITTAGAIAILAGLILYGAIWAGAGFSGPPRWYAMGGHIAIFVIILTGAVGLPAAHKLAALARALAGPEAMPTTEQKAQHERLMNRVTWVTQLSALLLIVTIALMAIGRYM